MTPTPSPETPPRLTTAAILKQAVADAAARKARKTTKVLPSDELKPRT